MKVVRPGVEYLLEDFTGGGQQKILFNNKNRQGEYETGTTVEELLEVLKHKLEHFQKRSPSKFNADALEHIRHVQGEFYARLQEKKLKLRNPDEDISPAR